MAPLLEVKNLKTYFRVPDGIVKAVDDVSFKIEKGEFVGLVGESGSGKSMLAMSILRLIRPPGKIEGGEILWKGTNLLQSSATTLRQIRGKQIAMIFQEPMTALNPVFTVEEQIGETIAIHEGGSKKAIQSRVLSLLQKVGIASAESRLKNYPHQLSGGMRQRVMIAMALACNPDLLIADEPTTALDVTIQAQILTLLKSLSEEFKMSLLLITHDFGIVAEMAHKVLVMYAGELVEEGECRAVFKSPQHPYTQGLLAAIPPLRKQQKDTPLVTIKGEVPNLKRLPKSCYFQDRCPKVQAICREQKPLLEEKIKEHKARCFFPGP